MSTLLEEEPVAMPSALPSGPRVDTLAASVVIMLLMTVAQRAIGFGRGIMFCRWLEPEELGQWDVAFGFLNLAAPLIVLGLPGSFGRYVEYFRQRGQFHALLRRTATVTVLVCVAATVFMLAQRDWLSRLIFGSDAEQGMVGWLALCLTIIILHNFLAAMFVAVRMYRIVTLLQFAQSLGFAVVSLALLSVWPAGAKSVIIAYAVASAVSAAMSIGWLRNLAANEAVAAEPLPQTAFWAKLAPFAIWMWITNLMANLFEVIDRFLIVHYSGMDSNDALRLVGYYHSSRLVPLLFVGVASLLGTMITPHLSFDWEAGRRDAVVRRLNQVLKLLLLSLFAVSVGVLFFAPLLFEVAFQNKFAGGLAVLPWTLTYCAWFGTIAVAQNYLWCAERPGLSSVSLFLGLLLNIGCNLILLPRFGLEGAVWSTTLANLAALTLTYAFSIRNGMRIDSGTWILTLAPLSLSFGPWVALGVLIAILVASIAGSRVLTAEEKRHVCESVAHGAGSLRRLAGKWAGAAAPTASP